MSDRAIVGDLPGVMMAMQGKPGKDISRRGFLQTGTLAAAGLAGRRVWSDTAAGEVEGRAPLSEFSYADVVMSSELHEVQLRETQAVLMSLSDDSLLKPFRK